MSSEVSARIKRTHISFLQSKGVNGECQYVADQYKTLGEAWQGPTTIAWKVSILCHTQLHDMVEILKELMLKTPYNHWYQNANCGMILDNTAKKLLDFTFDRVFTVSWVNQVSKDELIQTLDHLILESSHYEQAMFQAIRAVAVMQHRWSQGAAAIASEMLYAIEMIQNASGWPIEHTERFMQGYLVSRIKSTDLDEMVERWNRQQRQTTPDNN